MIKAFVVCEQGTRDVLGFYYLLNTSVEHDRLGAEGGGAQFMDITKIPAVYLGMIGVHEPLMRQGIGTQMMIHAFRQVVALSKLSGVWALTLDAVDDDAVDYYRKFEFRCMTAGEREMYLPLGTINSFVESLDE